MCGKINSSDQTPGSRARLAAPLIHPLPTHSAPPSPPPPPVQHPCLPCHPPCHLTPYYPHGFTSSHPQNLSISDLCLGVQGAHTPHLPHATPVPNNPSGPHQRPAPPPSLPQLPRLSLRPDWRRPLRLRAPPPPLPHDAPCTPTHPGPQSALLSPSSSANPAAPHYPTAACVLIGVGLGAYAPATNALISITKQQNAAAAGGALFSSMFLTAGVFTQVTPLGLHALGVGPFVSIMASLCAVTMSVAYALALWEVKRAERALSLPVSAAPSIVQQQQQRVWEQEAQVVQKDVGVGLLAPAAA